VTHGLSAHNAQLLVIKKKKPDAKDHNHTKHIGLINDIINSLIRPHH
jgi:hypothetical protein